MLEQSELSQLIKELKNLIENNEFIKITLSKSRDKEIKKLSVRIVTLLESQKLQFVYSYPKKDITNNLTINEGIEEIANQIGDNFDITNLFGTKQNWVLSKNKNQYKLTTNRSTIKTINTSHNKLKNNFINSSLPLWQELEVTGKDGNTKEKSKGKLNQINEFIKVLDRYILKIDQKPLKIIDMGCGKGYLTFAISSWMQNDDQAKVVGVEINKELVTKSNQIIIKNSIKNLNFVESSIDKYPSEKANILISLHACNTATDDAIIWAIKSKCELILCSPCCYQELNKQIKSKSFFQTQLRYGILKIRQAEIITDTLRALWLEYYNYKTEIIEFISSEFTHKNLLLIATKRNIELTFEQKEKILKEIVELKTSWNITNQKLDSLDIKI